MKMKRKILWVFLMLLGSSQMCQAGVFLKCKAESESLKDGTWSRKMQSNGVIVIDSVNGDCTDWRGNKYYVGFRGLGPAARVNNDYFLINCPFVRKARLEKKGELKFFGVKVNASAVAGATIGVFSNELLGVCLLSGVELGAGASISTGIMQIVKDPDDTFGVGDITGG